MKADLQFLSERFDRFNSLIFKNPLPRPMMHITEAKSFIGQFKMERHPRGGAGGCIYHISLSSRYDLPEEVLEDTVIHEMIHFLIHHNGIRDTSSHGKVFRQIMNDINSRFNRHVTVSHRCTSGQLDSDTRNSHSIVCLCVMTDGRHLVCKVTQSKVFEIYRAFCNWDKVASQEWYWVFGSYFNRYRKVVTPKLFSVDEEGLSQVRSGVALHFTKQPDGRLTLNPVR